MEFLQYLWRQPALINSNVLVRALGSASLALLAIWVHILLVQGLLLNFAQLFIDKVVN